MATSQTALAVQDPVERKNAGNNSGGSLFNAAWEDAQRSLQSTGAPPPRTPEPPADFEFFFDQSQYSRAIAVGPAKPTPISGEFLLDQLASSKEPADSIFEDPFYIPKMPRAPEGANRPPFADLLGALRKPEPPRILAIPPEEVNRRERERHVAISSVLGELKKQAAHTGFELGGLPVQLYGSAIEQLRTLVGATPTKEEKRAEREAKLKVATGLEEKAPEHLDEGMTRAAHERIAAERERSEQMEAKTQAAAQTRLQQADQENPLTQTGAKKSRGLLHMFGAVKKRGQTWFTGLRNKFVQLGHVIKKWLGGEQQAANRQG